MRRDASSNWFDLVHAGQSSLVQVWHIVHMLWTTLYCPSHKTINVLLIVFFNFQTTDVHSHTDAHNASHKVLFLTGQTWFTSYVTVDRWIILFHVNLDE